MFGGSGSGKTFGLRVILEEIMMKKIPGIVLDPHYEMDFTEAMPGIPSNFKQDFSRRFELFEVGKDVGILFSRFTLGRTQCHHGVFRQYV